MSDGSENGELHQENAHRDTRIARLLRYADTLEAMAIAHERRKWLYDALRRLVLWVNALVLGALVFQEAVVKLIRAAVIWLTEP